MFPYRAIQCCVVGERAYNTILSINTAHKTLWHLFIITAPVVTAIQRTESSRALFKTPVQRPETHYSAFR